MNLFLINSENSLFFLFFAVYFQLNKTIRIHRPRAQTHKHIHTNTQSTIYIYIETETNRNTRHTLTHTIKSNQYKTQTKYTIQPNNNKTTKNKMFSVFRINPKYTEVDTK